MDVKQKEQVAVAVAATLAVAKPALPVYERARPKAGDLVRKAATADVNIATRELTFVASDETCDRYGDIIRVAGWQLDAFKQNPVFLFGHDSSSPPIGRVSDIAVKGKKLLAKCEFLPAGMDEFADKLWAMTEAGFLRAVSVGFIPTARPEYIEDEDGRISGFEFVAQELMELSLVPVPANPNALALAKAFGEDSVRKMFLDYEDFERKQAAQDEAEREVSRFHFNIARRLDLARLGGSSK